MENIEIYCYLRTPRIFTSRRDAIRKYLDGIRSSEGSEQERYMNVLDNLKKGYSVCWDGIVSLPEDAQARYNKQLNK